MWPGAANAQVRAGRSTNGPASTPGTLRRAFVNASAPSYAPPMRTTVGRERELNVVSEFVASNRCGVLAIVGEPGIGKTTLWREAIKRARAAGSRVMLARPAEAESKLSFAGLADLLADVPDEFFAGLPEPQRNGIDAALLRRHADRAPARRVVATAFLSLLRALAAAEPIT